MKAMIKSLAVLLLAIIPFVSSAQNSKLFRETRVIHELQINDGQADYEVISLPENGQDHFFLSVGTLGIGDDIIQFDFDPVSVLFIPLGDTLADAQAKLEEIQALGKKPVGESIEIPGCLAVAYPNDQRENVIITHVKPLLQHQFEFKIRRESHIRATYVARSDFGSIVSGVKFYRKIHPKEQ